MNPVRAKGLLLSIQAQLKNVEDAIDAGKASEALDLLDKTADEYARLKTELADE